MITHEDVSRGTLQGVTTCTHKDDWRPGQRNCHECHAELQRAQRRRGRSKFVKACMLLMLAQARIHSDICLNYRCCEECERMTTFLKEQGLK